MMTQMARGGGIPGMPGMPGMPGAGGRGKQKPQPKKGKGAKRSGNPAKAAQQAAAQKEKAAADLKVESFRERLVRQFASLQSVQSQMGGITSFLKANDNAASKG